MPVELSKDVTDLILQTVEQIAVNHLFLTGNLFVFADGVEL